MDANTEGQETATKRGRRIWSLAWDALIFGSLIAAGFYLYQADYLTIPEVQRWGYFLLAFPALFAAFLIASRCWQIGARDFGSRFAYTEALAGNGLPVFTKYIPGKFWVIAGRVTYVKKARPEESAIRLGGASVMVQLVDIWMALTIGLAGFILIEGFGPWSWLFTAGWLASLGGLAYPPLRRWGLSLLARLIKRAAPLVSMPTIPYLRWLPWFFLPWALTGLGFYFLTAGLTDGPVPVAMMFVMPLATAIGMLAIIVPGGIGVREGILAGLIVALGYDLSVAVTLSAMSRVWFLAGEGFVFGAGGLAHVWNRRQAAGMVS